MINEKRLNRGENPDPKTPPPPPGSDKQRGGFTPLPELQFPRKLEDSWVRIFYGSDKIGIFGTDENEIWLLAPNIIKIDNGRNVWIAYNATYEVNYSKKD